MPLPRSTRCWPARRRGVRARAAALAGGDQHAGLRHARRPARAPAAAAGAAGRRPPSRSGLGVVAAGTVPLVDLDGGDISAGARFAHMQHEYQVLVNEQHICGAQMHVDVPDRDEAVQVVRRVAPHLPTLLAISASSPYWRGSDTGYASYRDLIWARWPTAGPPADGRDRRRVRPDDQGADRLRDDQRPRDGLLRRPAQRSRADRRAADLRRLPRGRLRRADRRPVPGARAQAREECAAGVPLPVVRHELLRAATWRAARSGLEGDLVDPAGSRARLPRAAPRAAGRLAAPAPGGAGRLRAGARSCRSWRWAAAARRPASAAGSGCGASSPTSSTVSSPPPRAATCRSTGRRPSSPRPSCSATTGRPGSTRRSARRATSCRSTAGCSARSPAWASTA